MMRSVVELARAAARRQPPGRALSAVAELRVRIDEIEEFQVANARERGWSWSEIARALGVTRQAVHRKYARRIESSRDAVGGGRMVVTADGRRAVLRARREAVVLGHGSVGTEHLLLGLLAEETIGTMLAGLGVSSEDVRETLGAPRRPRGRPAMRPATLPISGSARRALEQSLHEALRLGDDQIGARHVLLAVLRDEAGRAHDVLDRLGVDPAAIERELAR